jgi:iron-sulfur cluster assembly accessory protein
MITLTDSSVRQLKALVSEDGDPTKGLRIFVETGGCAGMQYGMKLDQPKPDDHVAARDGVSVLIDPASWAYLQGVTLDYSEDLAGSGFRIQNPNAVRSCGCGTSFEANREAAAQNSAAEN